MMKWHAVVSEDVDASRWDSSLGLGSENLLAHTTAWASRLRVLLGAETRYVAVEGTDGVVVRGAVHVFGNGRDRHVGWHGMPDVAPGAPAEALRAFVEAAAGTGKRLGARCVSRSRLGLWTADDAVAGWEWSRRRWASLRVDLRRPEEGLWDALERSARKAVRKARRSGIEVARIRERGELEAYYAFAEAAAQRMGKRLYGPEDFQTMFDILKDPAAVEVFVARRDGTIVAGLGVWGLGPVAEEWGSFHTADPDLRTLGAGDLVKWTALQWCRERGFAGFDLAGVHPEPRPGSKEAAIRRFKEKWGGVYYELLDVDKPLSQRAKWSRAARTGIARLTGRQGLTA